MSRGRTFKQHSLAKVRAVLPAVVIALFLGCAHKAEKPSNVEVDHSTALVQAKYKGTVKALREVIDNYPNTSSAEKAKAELPMAMFREARDVGTVTAYRDVTNQYPNSPASDEARKEIHTLYSNSLGNFRQRASNTHPRALLFVERLCAYLEGANDSTVEIRYREHNSNHPYSFSTDPSTAESKQIFEAFQYIFSDFQNDTLILRQGERLTNINKLDNLPLPTIIINYTSAISDREYRNTRGGTEFGTVIYLDVFMTVPGNNDSFNFSVTGDLPKKFTLPENMEMSDLATAAAIRKLKEVFINPEQ